MYLVTMQRLAAAKGFDSFIDYSEYVIDIVVNVDIGGGYWRIGEFRFTEEDDMLFNAIMNNVEDYLDTTYQ